MERSSFGAARSVFGEAKTDRTTKPTKPNYRNKSITTSTPSKEHGPISSRTNGVRRSLGANAPSKGVARTSSGSSKDGEKSGGNELQTYQSSDFDIPCGVGCCAIAIGCANDQGRFVAWSNQFSGELPVFSKQKHNNHAPSFSFLNASHKNGRKETLSIVSR